MKTQTLLKLKTPVGYSTWHEEPMCIILFKMCKAVGAPYYKINFCDTDWYMEYSWTGEQEEKFQEWMANQIYQWPSWRKAFQLAGKRKKEAMEIAKNFTWNHGWKTYSGS